MSTPQCFSLVDADSPEGSAATSDANHEAAASVGANAGSNQDLATELLNILGRHMNTGSLTAGHVPASASRSGSRHQTLTNEAAANRADVEVQVEGLDDSAALVARLHEILKDKEDQIYAQSLQVASLKEDVRQREDIRQQQAAMQERLGTVHEELLQEQAKTVALQEELAQRDRQAKVGSAVIVAQAAAPAPGHDPDAIGRRSPDPRTPRFIRTEDGVAIQGPTMARWGREGDIGSQRQLAVCSQSKAAAAPKEEALSPAEPVVRSTSTVPASPGITQDMAIAALENEMQKIAAKNQALEAAHLRSRAARSHSPVRPVVPSPLLSAPRLGAPEPLQATCVVLAPDPLDREASTAAVSVSSDVSLPVPKVLQFSAGAAASITEAQIQASQQPVSRQRSEDRLRESMHIGLGPKRGEPSPRPERVASTPPRCRQDMMSASTTFPGSSVVSLSTPQTVRARFIPQTKISPQQQALTQSHAHLSSISLPLPTHAAQSSAMRLQSPTGHGSSIVSPRSNQAAGQPPPVAGQPPSIMTMPGSYPAPAPTPSPHGMNRSISPPAPPGRREGSGQTGSFVAMAGGPSRALPSARSTLGGMGIPAHTSAASQGSSPKAPGAKVAPAVHMRPCRENTNSASFSNGNAPPMPSRCASMSINSGTVPPMPVQTAPGAPLSHGTSLSVAENGTGSSTVHRATPVSTTTRAVAAHYAGGQAMVAHYQGSHRLALADNRDGNGGQRLAL